MEPSDSLMWLALAYAARALGKWESYEHPEPRSILDWAGIGFLYVTFLFAGFMFFVTFMLKFL